MNSAIFFVQLNSDSSLLKFMKSYFWLSFVTECTADKRKMGLFIHRQLIGEKWRHLGNKK